MWWQALDVNQSRDHRGAPVGRLPERLDEAHAHARRRKGVHLQVYTALRPGDGQEHARVCLLAAVEQLYRLGRRDRAFHRHPTAPARLMGGAENLAGESAVHKAKGGGLLIEPPPATVLCTFRANYHRPVFRDAFWPAQRLSHQNDAPRPHPGGGHDLVEQTEVPCLHLVLAWFEPKPLQTNQHVVALPKDLGPGDSRTGFRPE